MATPGDMDENVELAREQALVLELLYGELDDAEVDAAERSIADDDELSAELEAFASVRSLMRQLPDEDPPQAVSAKLLHAAAEAAPAAEAARVEESGFFAWLKKFFMPIAMHPAATAVATLVVVVGVAGALYLTGNWKVAEPTADTEAQQADRSSAMASDDRMAGAEKDPAPERVDDEDEAVADVTKTQPPLQENKKLQGKLGTRKNAPAPPRTARLAKPEEQPKVTSRSTTEISPDGNRNKDYRYKERARRRVQHTKAAGTPKPKTKAPKKLDQAAEGKARALHKKARLAAKKGQCARVTKIGRTIRNVNQLYWSNNVRNDPRLRCGKAVDAFEAGDEAVTTPTKK